MIIEKNELDELFIVNMAFGLGNLIMSFALLMFFAMWDFTAKAMFINHEQGYGYQQILAILFCGLWCFLSFMYIKLTKIYWEHYGK